MIKGCGDRKGGNVFYSGSSLRTVVVRSVAKNAPATKVKPPACVPEKCQPTDNFRIYLLPFDQIGVRETEQKDCAFFYTEPARPIMSTWKNSLGFGV
jgi:hypothetical protein